MVAQRKEQGGAGASELRERTVKRQKTWLADSPTGNGTRFMRCQQGKLAESPLALGTPPPHHHPRPPIPSRLAILSSAPTQQRENAQIYYYIRLYRRAATRAPEML
jgi:hypothetical protein